MLAIAAPLAAQPTASTNIVAIPYSTGQPVPSGTVVTISNATNISERIAQNIGPNGAVVNSAADNPGVFSASVGSGLTVNIGIANSSILASLAQLGPNTYTGTILVSADSCTDCIPIYVALIIGNTGQISVTQGGVAIPPAGITLSAVAGGSASTTLTISTASASAIAYSITSSQPWLTVSPTAGTIGGSAGVALITVTANAAASGIVSGTNVGSLNIITSLGSPSIPVTFTNLGNSGVTLAPSSMSFSYASGTQTYFPAQSQSLVVSGVNGRAVTANSNQPWLLVNGSSSANVVGPSLTISVNALALGNPPPANIYSGQINFIGVPGLLAQLTVTLTVSATSTGSGLTFVGSSGATPPPQSFTITGNGPYSIVATVSSPSNTHWLQISPPSGILSGSAVVTASVSTAGLNPGTYTGFILVSINGVASLTIPVTLIFGASPAIGPLAAPSLLTFNVPAGGSQSQTILITGSGGAGYTVQVFGNGISVDQAAGATPYVLGVTVNAASSGVAPGVNTGYLLIQSNGVTQTVNITFNVLSGTLLLSNPASVTVISQGGFGVTNLFLASTIDNPATGAGLPFSIAAPPGFVSLTGLSGTTPATIAVSINTSGLATGINSGNLVITSPGAVNSPLNIPVTVLAPAAAGLTITPSSLGLTGVTGGAAVVQIVALSGLSGTAYATSVNSSAASWLSVSPTTGTSPASLRITANPASLSPNTYNGTITVTALNGSSITLNVTFTVTPILVTVNPGSVTFHYLLGGAPPAPQSVTVSASGGTVMGFTTSSNASWVTVAPNQGITPSSLNVFVNPAGLSGTQVGTVTITGTNGTTAVLNVTLMVASVMPAVKINLTVWRPSNGVWFVDPPTGTPSTPQWGLTGDIPVAADFNGDGVLDYVVWRPSNGTWYVMLANVNTPPTSFQWGLPGDIPVGGDFDGDGKTDYAVWRPSNGTWYIVLSSTGAWIQKQWGLPNDIPVVADFDGDGKTDYAVWRPSEGNWYVTLSSTGATVVQQWGLPGDIPVAADYAGTGKAEFAVWRPANSTWYILPSAGGPPVLVTWGLPGDIPVPRDYDGDGKADPAVWRPTDGTWNIIPSTSPASPLQVQWGLPNDIPLYKPAGT